MIEFVYGQDFVGSAQLLTILLPAFLSICLGYVFTGLVLSGGSLWPYAVVTGVAAVLNVAGNFVVIPTFGATGAAWLTLATEFSVMTAVAMVARHRVPVALPWGRWLRTGLATAAMAAAIVAVSDRLPLLLVLVTAAIVFGVAAGTFGAVRRVDMERLLSRTEGITG
jgi:O-antigen/teichoic acid export membrane protein